MATLLETLRAQFDANRATADQITVRYSDDGAELSDADKDNLAELHKENTRLSERISELAAMDTTAAELDQVMGRRSAAMGGVQQIPGAERPAAGLGAALLESAELARWKAQGMDGASSEVVAEFALIPSKDAGGLPLAGKAQVRDAPLPGLVTPILDSFATESTDKNEVWWIEYPSASPEAAITAEGAAMPEAVYAPVVRTGSAEAWKHSIPITEEAVDDDARLASIVEGALMRGVRRKAEKSAGTALTGTTGYLTVTGAADMIKGARLAIAKLQSSAEQYQPSHVYINPTDYADVDLALLEKTLNGAVQNSTPWGLIYVPSSYVAAGTLYVADAQAAFLFIDRRQVRLAMTDSHASEFVSDILRVKATARGKVVCQRKDAVVKVTKAVALAGQPDEGEGETAPTAKRGK